MSRDERERLRDIREAITAIHGHLQRVNKAEPAMDDSLLHREVRRCAGISGDSGTSRQEVPEAARHFQLGSNDRSLAGINVTRGTCAGCWACDRGALLRAPSVSPVLLFAQSESEAVGAVTSPTGVCAMSSPCQPPHCRDSMAHRVGLLAKKIARSTVTFAGLHEYADSGDDDIPIIAQVEVIENRPLGKNPSLPFLGPLGAARLLSLLRREPQFVVPFMDVVSSVSAELLNDDADLAEFSVRGSIITDPAALDAGIALSAYGSEAGGLSRAQLNSSVPVLVEQLPGDAERSTTVDLVHQRNGTGSVRFKFGLGSSNALTTIGSWTATVDYLATRWPREQMATPIGEGLRVLGAAWDEVGNPPGVGVPELAELEALLTLVTAKHLLE